MLSKSYTNGNFFFVSQVEQVPTVCFHFNDCLTLLICHFQTYPRCILVYIRHCFVPTKTLSLPLLCLSPLHLILKSQSWQAFLVLHLFHHFTNQRILKKLQTGKQYEMEWNFRIIHVCIHCILTLPYDLWVVISKSLYTRWLRCYSLPTRYFLNATSVKLSSSFHDDIDF